MGARNAMAAFVAWPDLDDKPMRLLQYMALVALDEGTPTQPARTFWGGREDLAAVALGRRLPPEPSAGDMSEAARAARVARETAFTAVKRGLRTLSTAGAITQVRAGRNGKRSEYRLNVSPWDRQGDTHRPPQEDTHRPPEGDTHRPPEGDTHRPPEEPQRNHRGEPGGQPRPRRARHLGGTSVVDGGDSPRGEVGSKGAPVVRLRQRAAGRVPEASGPGDEGEPYRRALERLGAERMGQWLERAYHEGVTGTEAMIRRAAEMAGVAP